MCVAVLFRANVRWGGARVEAEAGAEDRGRGCEGARDGREGARNVNSGRDFCRGGRGACRSVVRGMRRAPTASGRFGGGAAGRGGAAGNLNAGERTGGYG